MTQSRANLLLASLALFVLVGCSSNPDQDVASQPFPYYRLSPSAPPQPPIEEIPPAEQPMNHLWRKGYWDFDGAQFVWIPGHFISRPDPTAAWTPDRWEQRAFGWAFVPGYWQ